jgi:hypothetical protein
MAGNAKVVHRVRSATSEWDHMVKRDFAGVESGAADVASRVVTLNDGSEVDGTDCRLGFPCSSAQLILNTLHSSLLWIGGSPCTNTGADGLSLFFGQVRLDCLPSRLVRSIVVLSSLAKAVSVLGLVLSVVSAHLLNVAVVVGLGTFAPARLADRAQPAARITVEVARRLRLVASRTAGGDALHALLCTPSGATGARDLGLTRLALGIGHAGR